MMTAAELQAKISVLNAYQIEQVAVQVSKYLKLNDELKDTIPTVCPCCSETEAKFIKKGFQSGKQRYQCKCCGRKFTYDTGCLTSCSHQPPDAWNTVIEDTLNWISLDKTAVKISVCHETAFNMRHKLLAFLEKIADSFDSLGELVEMDETYVLESSKGRKVDGRKPRKHGAKASKRGLSAEQFCVCVAADRSKHMAARCVNRAKPSAADVENALGSYIQPESVILCDGSNSYDRLAADKRCEKIVLSEYEMYNRLYHLNTVNGLHSQIKTMLDRYRGVASKYLNRYLALFTVSVNFGKPSLEESVDNIRNTLKSVRCYITYMKSQSLNLLTL